MSSESDTLYLHQTKRMNNAGYETATRLLGSWKYGYNNICPTGKLTTFNTANTLHYTA